MIDVTAARHNNLQSRIALILGNGAGQNGYGQTLSSYQVNNSGKIAEAADINAVYSDMVKARVHQTGTVPTSIAQIVQNLNTIALTESNFISNSGITTVDPNGSKKGITDFENLMNSIEADKFIMHPSQANLALGISSTRTTQWNGIIYHELTVTFNSADRRRHFFNSGGELRFSSNITGASTPKGQDWAALCSSTGTVKFNYNSTTTTGSGSGSSIGNYELTSSYQTVFNRIGGGTFSGVYAGNILTIKARAPSTSTIQFRIEFNDIAVDNLIDDNVTGILTSSIQHYRADSANVSIPAPTFTNNASL
jgi:hypothetical protein